MRIPYLVRHIIFTGSAATLVSAISYLVGIFLARSLGPTGRGDLAIVLNSLNLLYPLTSLGIRQASAFMIARENLGMRAARALQIRILPFSAALTFGAFLATIALSARTSLNNDELLAILAIIPLRLFFEFRSGLFLASKRLPEYSALQVVQPLTEAALLTGAFLIFGASISVYLYCMAGAFMLASILQSHQLGQDANESQNSGQTLTTESVIRIVKLGLTFALPLFIMGINYSIDIAIMSFLGTDSSKIGLYSISVSISYLILFFPKFVNLVIFSHSLNNIKKSESNFSLYLFKYSLFIFIILSIISFIFTRIALLDFIVFIYGQSFSNAYDSLCLLLPGTLAMLFFKILNGDLAGRGHPSVATKIFGPMAILNIGLNLWWIPEYHELGAAAATSVSYVLGAAIYLVMYWRIAIRDQ
ncbi:polysaccharide biosynthesis C-terminal domain-containing protein [Sphingosinicella xenopeptidilytica]|uniref:Polysaccharide biosynthesis C-terminal domain-containing protein n=1 Tax=Sphingosinicella xenopeptidilytica TaxID=364098 RepID=A0ABW3C3T7_SPHXN